MNYHEFLKHFLVFSNLKCQISLELGVFFKKVIKTLLMVNNKKKGFYVKVKKYSKSININNKITTNKQHPHVLQNNWHKHKRGLIKKLLFTLCSSSFFYRHHRILKNTDRLKRKYFTK